MMLLQFCKNFKHEDTGFIIPANTKHLYNIYTMLDQRLQRWSNIV